MDITSFIISSREKAMLFGDYATYRTQLSGRLLNCRKKLGIATKNRGKFHPRPPLTPELVAENREYLSLHILTAERAWAHAMSMKSAHAADTKGISGSTRSHIISRLNKAAKVAEQLADVLSQRDASTATQSDVLEARAYASLVRGAELLERQSWERCLASYATARVIYDALSSSTKRETFKDLLTETIDPSIRYAAYQLKTPRSLPIPAIARKAFPRSDGALVASVHELDPEALAEEDDDAKKGGGLLDGAGTPTTLTFRSREVRIEDAAIATAWLALEAAKSSLAERLSSGRSGPRARAAADLSPREKAAAYDGVLTASQDSVDATKQAIDELRAEGVTQGDPRMQSLAITRTAVNYEMISWRIGRNRVLTGERDGALLEFGAPLRTRRKASSKEKAAASEADAPAERTKPEPPGRQLAKLKEKTVLYDGTLQSLESIKELPGVAADSELSAWLEATTKYFTALKCLAIGRSHAIVGNMVNALALIKHAYDQCHEAGPVLSKFASSKSSSSSPSSSPSLTPRNIEVSEEDVRFLDGLLNGEVQRHRALVDIHNMQKQAGKGSVGKTASAPLSERLGQYPADGAVDLDNIVAYPPKLDGVPVKPAFLDIAWNYIDYPNKKDNQDGRGAVRTAPQDEQKPQKKGWFGFGR